MLLGSTLFNIPERKNGTGINKPMSVRFLLIKLIDISFFLYMINIFASEMVY